MATLLLTYDLNKERGRKTDYTGFYKIRDQYDFVKLSESSYALNTSESPQGLVDKLRQYIDSNDHIYVISLRRPYAGFGPQSTNDWLEKNLGN